MIESSTLEDLKRLMARGPGCPVCRYEQQAGVHFLDGLLYESVNDFGLRQQLTRSLGFCAYHSWASLAIPGTRLGTAIIEQAMLKEALRRLHDQSPGRRSLLGKRASLPSEDRACPVCVHEQQAATRAIEELVKAWDETWARALESAGGLCYNHLRQAIHLAPDPVTARALKDVHAHLWQQMVDYLDEFIRKHDYRFREETILDEESEALRQAIRILTGEPRPSPTHS